MGTFWLLLLGFSSGLPLALSGSTLQARLTSEGVSLNTIGLLTLAGIPYAWKFLWAPLFDRIRLPFLGRRRGWMLICQLALMAMILVVGTLSARDHPLGLGLAALGLAFVSASQDIVIDAYRVDLLPPSARGLGASLTVSGYRIAMLVSGGVALLWAAHRGWDDTALLMAGCMIPGILATLLAPEPDAVPNNTSGSMRKALAEPLMDFWTRHRALSWLALVVLYKLGDALAGALSTAFLLRGLGFDLVAVATVNKGVGLAATLGGAVLGGVVMIRWGLYRALWHFGWFQGLSVLSFAALALTGKHFLPMVGAVVLENFSAGMGTTAFTALLMGLCNPRYSATQFALLSALAASGRVYLGPLAGWLTTHWGWGPYFLIATAVALPGLVMVRHLRPEIQAL